MIAHNLKAIFIHITKTAGSSIEVALNEVEQRDDGAIDPATGDFVKVITGEEKHMTARAVQDLSLIHISEPTRQVLVSRMPSSA